MNLLTMEHVTKSYTDRILLNDVGFGINENEKIGVIGINGMRVSVKGRGRVVSQSYAPGSAVVPGGHCELVLDN